MSDDRGIAYWEKRDGEGLAVLRASALGGPLRCLVLALMDEYPKPPPKYLSDAAAAGTAAEPVVKARMRKLGYIVDGEQNEIEIDTGQGAIVRGHLDGMICIDPADGVNRILEVKSMSPGVWEKWKAWRFEGFTTYQWQLSVYMHAAHQLRGSPVEATYAIVNRETDELEITTVSAPPIPLDDIKAKAVAVKNLAALDFAPGCDGSSPYPCAFDYLCDKRRWEFAELEEGEDDTLARLVEEYDGLRGQITELESRKEFARSEIRTVMGDRQKVQIPGWSFSMTEVKRKPVLDLDALRAHLGEKLDEFYRTPEPGEPVLYIRKSK